MVDATKDLMQLAASEAYQKSLRWLAERGCEISPADEFNVPVQLKPFALSGCDVAELRASLDEEPEAFNWFVAKKLSAFADDDEEEYPPGEEPPPEERAVTIGVGRYSELFLIRHLCEFTLLRQRPEELEPYAKRYRIPQAKKYAKTLVRLFGEAREKASKQGAAL